MNSKLGSDQFWLPQCTDSCILPDVYVHQPCTQPRCQSHSSLEAVSMSLWSSQLRPAFATLWSACKSTGCRSCPKVCAVSLHFKTRSIPLEWPLSPSSHLGTLSPLPD